MYFDVNLCRREAPKYRFPRGRWPRVLSTDWCGEWRSDSDDWRTAEEPTHQTVVDAMASAIDALGLGGL